MILILVVVEDGLVLQSSRAMLQEVWVLILVVMDDGLIPIPANMMTGQPAQS